MGLGAPKKRSKLSQDPNNTTWSKSTTNFGHRILASQGWEPGQYLGATDAAHAAHYTAANASHIRVLLREDNLGIGAKVGGNGRAETFGLATLSGIFGRLNGKSEGEVQKQQDNLRDAELRAWQGNKFGVISFVYGGLLVGDKMEEEMKEKLGTGGKKRKAEVEDEKPADEEKRVKRKKAEENLRAEASSSSSSSEESEHEIKKRAKKEKKEKKEKKKKAASDGDESETDAKPLRKEARRKAKRDAAAEDSSEADSTTDDKAKRKVEKKARKEEKKKRKEEKRKLKSANQSATSTPASSTPATGSSTPMFGGSRHAVRQRYIQQKRMASLDPQALKEILMLKVQ